MEYISLVNVAERVKNHPINFIGSAVTPWHAHGIDCAIHYLQDQGIEVNGLILIKPAIKQQEICHLLSEKNFTTNCCQVFKIAAVFDTRPLSVLKSMYRLYKSVSWYNKQYNDQRERTIFIASPWHLDVSLFIQLHQTLNNSFGYRLMLVDEGLSSYFPNIDTRQHLLNSLKTKKQGLHLLRSYLVASIGMTLRQRFEKKTSWSNLNLFYKNTSMLKANALVIKYYTKVLTDYVQANTEQLPTDNLNGSIVICTMAYIDSEIYDYEDIRVLTSVVKEIKKKGIKVYIKPHPRDNDYHDRYGQLDCRFIESHCTMEALFVRFPKIRAVVSFSSTCLVTANALFNLKGISVLNLTDKKKFGKYIRQEMDSFLYCFSNIVKVPNNLEEFVSSL